MRTLVCCPNDSGTQEGLTLGEVLAVDFEYKTQKHTMGVEKYLKNSKTTACVNSQLICGWPSLFTSLSLMAKEQHRPCGLLWSQMLYSNSFVKKTQTIMSEMRISWETEIHGN